MRLTQIRLKATKKSAVSIQADSVAKDTVVSCASCCRYSILLLSTGAEVLPWNKRIACRLHSSVQVELPSPNCNKAPVSIAVAVLKMLAMLEQ